MIEASAKNPAESINGLGEKVCDDSAYMVALYQKYKSLLFQKAQTYTKDPYAQEDIVQESLLRLMKNIPKLQTVETAALVAYLTLTVRSTALNYFQDERRDSLNAVPLPDDYDLQECVRLDAPVQLSLEEQVLKGQRDEDLRNAIGRLSERDQLLLTGKYFLELDNRELADILGVKLSGMRVLLFRARNRALKELVKEGILHG